MCLTFLGELRRLAGLVARWARLLPHPPPVPVTRRCDCEPSRSRRSATLLGRGTDMVHP